jgi:transcriptional regulator of aromatic amino acid metabolism
LRRYAEAQLPGFVGLYQANAQSTRSLTGRGEGGVVLIVDGETANIVVRLRPMHTFFSNARRPAEGTLFFLFGHEKGAFMGTRTRKIGRLNQANGGTLFLDEIDYLPSRSQVMLLRVLLERNLKRVGGTESIDIDIRLIAATNQDLRREVEEGRFRRDLYDSLCEYPIRTPSLREHTTYIREASVNWLGTSRVGL